MRISSDIRNAAPIAGKAIAGGALAYFSYLTVDAIVRQRSIQATLLPGVGVLVASLWLFKSPREERPEEPKSVPLPAKPATIHRFDEKRIETSYLSNREEIEFFTCGHIKELFARRLNRVTGEQEPLSTPQAVFNTFTHNIGKDRSASGLYYHLSEGQKRDLLALALTPNEKGEYPIVLWRPEESRPLLTPALPTDVQKQLFVRYVDSHSLVVLLEECPDAVLGVRDLSLIQLALKDPRRTRKCVETMRAKGIEFIPEELWVVRAVDDLADFEDGEFTTLGEEEREKIYRIANGLHARNLIARLQTLGMRQTSFEHYASLKPMIGMEMDLFAAEEAMLGYFRQLRSQGLLMTRSEFEQLDPALYRKKTGALERILGAQWIETVARQFNSPRVMVPRKIAVINDNLAELTVDLASMSCPITVYAQNVTRVTRKREVDEVVQLMTVTKHSRFLDFGGDNLFTTEDGFCFIDTEFSSFSSQPISLEQLRSFASFVEESDRPAILEKAEELFLQERFRSQEREAFQSYFNAHPHRYLIDIIGSVTIPVAAIFGSSSN